MPKVVQFDSFYPFAGAQEYHKYARIVFAVVYYMGGILIYPFVKNTQLLESIKNIVSRLFKHEHQVFTEQLNEKAFSAISKVHTFRLTKPSNSKLVLDKIHTVVKSTVNRSEKYPPSRLIVKLDSLLQNIDRDFNPTLPETKRTKKLIRSSIKELVKHELTIRELQELISPKVSGETLGFLRKIYDDCVEELSYESNSDESSENRTLDDPLNWPQELSGKKKTEIEAFIENNRKTFKNQFASNPQLSVIENKPNARLSKIYLGRGGKKGGVAPSKKTYILRDDILVDTGEILGKGGQVTVEKYFGLISNQYFAVKKLSKKSDLFDSTILAYDQLKGKKGCVSYVMISDNLVVEPCYEGTLEDELTKGTFKTTHEKLTALVQIAAGLKSIHSETMTVKYSEFAVNHMADENRFVGVRVWNGPMSHGDLTWKNILVRRQGGKLQLHIGDYGFTAQGREVSYCRDFCSPQSAQFIENHKTLVEAGLFNYSLGVQNDLWQFGILAAAILKNKLQEGHPPLKFLKNFRDRSKRDELLSMMSLTQKAIDAEVQVNIANIEQSDLPMEEKKILVACWKVVNQLLQVQAHKRPNIERIQKKFRKLCSN